MKKSYSPAFKARLVRKLLREEKPASQLAARHGLHPNQGYRWREITLAGRPSRFEREGAQTEAAQMAAHQVGPFVKTTKRPK